MADNALISTPASGKVVLADEVTDPVLGTGVVQLVKLVDGTLDGTAKVGATGSFGLQVDVTRAVPATAASPQKSYSTTAAVAAGGSVNLDGPQITTGKTGHLLQVLVACSVAFKAEVRTILDGVAGANVAVWFSNSGGWDWTTPGPGFVTVAQSAGVGLDGFRVVVTVEDPSEPADVYASLFFDER